MTTTIEQAKKSISDYFMERYLEWVSDINSMRLTDVQFGVKYGWSRPQNFKNNLKYLKWFQSHIFNGHYIQTWEKLGYDKQTISDLCCEGFLSLKNYYDWTSLQTGKTTFFYIPQKTAVEIYKSFKSENIVK